jgi:uncharacterized membrane protein YedE/YeeE
MLQPFLHPLAGGVLIGLSAGGFYLLLGHIAGVSGLLARALSLKGVLWPRGFILGLIVAGVISRLLGTRIPPMLLDMSPAWLAMAGLLVGVGAGLGSGCTSGHGVCGLARLSWRSFVAVLTFMATASITLFIVRHGGLS